MYINHIDFGKFLMCRPKETAFFSPCFNAGSGIFFLESSAVSTSTGFRATNGAKGYSFGTRC